MQHVYNRGSWQINVQMSDVKKRKDLKKIMIIGAGPIIIGQVGNCACGGLV